jgi:hypothetical protein
MQIRFYRPRLATDGRDESRHLRRNAAARDVLGVGPGRECDGGEVTVGAAGHKSRRVMPGALEALRSARTATDGHRVTRHALQTRVGSQDGVSRACGSGAWWLPRGRTRRRSEGGHTREGHPTGQGIAWISAVRINSANRVIDLPRPGIGKSLGREICYTDGCRRR